jgi:hypothetical protein
VSDITEDEVLLAWRASRVVWQPWRPHAAPRWTVPLPLVRSSPMLARERKVTFSRLTRRDVHGQLHVMVVRGGTVLDTWPAGDLDEGVATDPTPVPVAIARLIEEVRHETETGQPAGYNRVYSRHNRS